MSLSSYTRLKYRSYSVVCTRKKRLFRCGWMDGWETALTVTPGLSCLTGRMEIWRMSEQRIPLIKYSHPFTQHPHHHFGLFILFIERVTSNEPLNHRPWPWSSRERAGGGVECMCGKAHKGPSCSSPHTRRRSYSCLFVLTRINGFLRLNRAQPKNVVGIINKCSYA